LTETSPSITFCSAVVREQVEGLEHHGSLLPDLQRLAPQFACRQRRRIVQRHTADLDCRDPAIPAGSASG
jgi:hypothetical protein